MKNAFFEICNENVDLMSDLGARFQAVASELFSLFCYSEYVLQQAFPQTASGQYLEYHAALRDIKRKTASRAYGTLTFFAADENETDIEIPKGTVCSIKEHPYIQFETTENAVIEAGQTSVTVLSQALENGEQYNAKEDTVTVMVNPPTSVLSVTNADAFTGGWDDESDEALRKRILASYRIPQMGVSSKSIAEAVIKLDDVLDCNIIKSGESTIYAYVKTKSNTISDELKQQIEDALMIAKITSSSVIIELAKCMEYDLVVDIEASDISGVEESVSSAIKNIAESVRIGESIILNKLSFAALAVSNANYCEAGSPAAVNGVINADSDTYLKLKSITVNCYEQ